jgi:general stress protein CsbA
MIILSVNWLGFLFFCFILMKIVTRQRVASLVLMVLGLECQGHKGWTHRHRGLWLWDLRIRDL